MDQVAAILEAANKRIRPTTGELLPALKARLGDSNKNLTIQAMELCAIVATAMGTAFEKCVRILLPGVLQNLNDNKVQVRNAAIATLTAFNEVSSLESMLSSIAAALVVDSPNLRKDLLAWLAERVDSYKPGPKKEVNQLVLPLLACMQDRSSDVRKLAQALLPFVCQWVGVDLVKEKCQDLRTAASQSLLPLIDACRDGASAGPSLESIASESAPGPVKSVPSRARPATAPAQASPSAGASGLSRASSKLTLKKKTGSASSSSASINHAAIAASTASADQAVDVAPPFLTSDSRLKEKRANDDRGMYKWTFDAPRKELVDFLRDQCEGCLSPTLVKLLFSEGHHKDRDFIEGLSLIDEYLAHPSLAQDRFGVDEEEFKQRVLANSDLVLKYITIRLFDSNTSSLFKVLDVLDHMFVIIDQSSAQLLEYEASAFLPYFLQKVGHEESCCGSK